MTSRTTNNVINEQLSAFIDGELTNDELSLLLRQIDKDPSILTGAQNLQKTQLLIQGEQPIQTALAAKSLFENIHNAIAQEEAFTANIAVGKQQVVNQSTVSEHTANATSNNQVAANDQFWKGFAGAGIAATVAMFAVNLWQAPTTNLESQSAKIELSANNPDVAQSYTVPKYIAPNETDSTTFFLEPGDLQPISLGEQRQSLANFNFDYEDQLLSNRTILLRMHEAEKLSQEL